MLVNPVRRPIRLHRRARRHGRHHDRLPVDHRVRVRPAHQHRRQNGFVRVPGVVPVFIRPHRRHLPPRHRPRRARQSPQRVIGVVHRRRHHAVPVLVNSVRRPIRLHRRARRHGRHHHRLTLDHRVRVRRPDFHSLEGIITPRATVGRPRFYLFDPISLASRVRRSPQRALIKGIDLFSDHRGVFGRSDKMAQNRFQSHPFPHFPHPIFHFRCTRRPP